MYMYHIVIFTMGIVHCTLVKSIAGELHEYADLFFHVTNNSSPDKYSQLRSYLTNTTHLYLASAFSYGVLGVTVDLVM